MEVSGYRMVGGVVCEGRKNTRWGIYGYLNVRVDHERERRLGHSSQARGNIWGQWG